MQRRSSKYQIQFCFLTIDRAEHTDEVQDNKTLLSLKTGLRHIKWQAEENRCGGSLLTVTQGRGRKMYLFDRKCYDSWRF